MHIWSDGGWKLEVMSPNPESTSINIQCGYYGFENILKLNVINMMEPSMNVQKQKQKTKECNIKTENKYQ